MRFFYKIVFLLNLIGINLINAQTYQHEIGFQTDNDSYTLIGSDRYYTNGLNFFYNKAVKFKNEKLENKIFGIKVSQEMFTPKSIKITTTDDIDRPFAGYLYLEPSLNLFYKNEENLRFSTQVGVIGKMSGAKEAQRFIHTIFDLDKPTGWEFQIKNNFIINFSVEYNKLLLRKSRYDITFNSKVNAGNGFIGINTGPTIRIGRFNPLYNSKITNSTVHTSAVNSSRRKEFYFYYRPKINYNAYNATVEGNIFKKNTNNQEVSSSIKSFVLTNEIGLDYRKNNFSVGASITLQTKDVKTMKHSLHQWGSINFSRLF